MNDPHEVQQAVHDVASGAAALIDVRGEDEWNDVRAEGAIHWPISRLRSDDIPDIPLDQKVYVYCAGGVRAEEAKDILLAHGFGEVVNIGGLSDWQKAGGEIE
ncbi:MAG: rhodanese-like domain-containing protein [Candidatus Pacebacteria bacterium]|nr:rhodanese-like domain-containing protein [Candidatus Paceibacterota bacterium]